MTATLILAAICAAGVVFMLRFLFAISKYDQSPLVSHFSLLPPECLDEEEAGTPPANEPRPSAHISAAGELQSFPAQPIVSD